MKKQLLMLGLGLLGSVTMSAQLSSPFTGAQPSDEIDAKADYYIYNVKSGKWLQNNDDHASDPPNNASLWTTRAELGTRGIDWEVKCLVQDPYGNMYQLNPKFNGNGSMNASNLYLDTNEGVTQWVLEPASDAGVPNAFRICANTGDYPYLYVGTDGWLGASVDGENDGENDVWQLVTKEERLEYMKKQAELNGSADATWLIGCPTFANQDKRYSNWVASVSKGGHDDIITHGPANGYSGDGAVNCNRIYEIWSSWNGSLTQNIKELPDGTYGLSVQGYYREGSADDVKDWNQGEPFAYDLWSTDAEHHYASYFANSTSAPLMSIFDGAKDARETGYEYNAKMTDPEWGDVLESGKWVPNSTDQASYALFYGAYQNPEIKTSVAGGTLSIGVTKEQGVNDDWIIVDNFRLTYYGSAIDIDQVKETLAQAIKDAEAVTVSSTDAINNMLDEALTNGKSVYEKSSDATEIGNAATAITTALQLIKETSTNANFLKQTVALAQNEKVEGEAMTTAADVAVNGVTSDAINSALDNLRMARRLNAAERQENLYKGNAPVAGNAYYLYNVGQKRFFCGGEDWGAHAALGFPGIEVTLVATETEGAFVIDTRLRNGENEHYLNYGGYCDTGAQDPWTFEKVSEGVYLIKRTNASEEQIAEGNVYLGYRPGRYATVDTDMGGADVADNHWILVTKADRDALLEAASEENPVDASYMIKMPNFNQREYEITGGWDNVDGSDYAWEHLNGNIYGRGQNKADFAFECFNQDPLNLIQTVYDLLPGYYVLSVQGYYRDCTEVDYTQAIAAGGYEPQQLAKLYALDGSLNEFSTKLVTIDQYANYAPGYGWNSNTSVGWIPNDPEQATSYFQVGAYKNSVLVKVGDDGTLSIGVKKDGGIEKDWVCIDNFRLTYLGEQTPTGINGVTEDVEAVKDGKIYNLQGIQVKDATQRGIYIKNGKKFVVK